MNDKSFEMWLSKLKMLYIQASGDRDTFINHLIKNHYTPEQAISTYESTNLLFTVDAQLS